VKVGDARGFIRKDKITYLAAGGASPVFLYHIYPTDTLRDWAMVKQGRKVVDKNARQQLQKAAEKDKKKERKGYLEYKKTYAGDANFRFDDEDLRIDTAYSDKQLTELGLYFGVSTDYIQQGGMLSEMDEKWGDTEERDKKLQRNRIIYDRAVDYFQNFDYAAYDALFRANTFVQLDHKLASMQTDQLIVDLLTAYEGVIVAESHTASSSKQFLVDNIRDLIGAGLDTIYVEHFRYREHQRFIDEFMASPAGSAFPPSLEKLVKHLDASTVNDYPYNIRGLLVTAKAQNPKIRIIALDDQAGIASKNTMTSRKGDYEWAEERVVKMNFIGMGRIHEDEAKRQGKYAILMGAAHSQTHAGAQAGRVQGSVAGLAQILKLPVITPDTGKTSGMARVREDMNKRTTLA